MKKIVITGGAGFVGSNLAIQFKKNYANCEVIAFDNLKREGSSLNVERLRSQGVQFVHGDVRSQADLQALPAVDLLIEASAEPSVHAGYGAAPNYCLETNLMGALNCVEFLRQRGGALVFISSSRVYPIQTLRSLPFEEYATRFDLPANQSGMGWSIEGINEQFPLFVNQDSRSLYGASKLSAELVLLEYAKMYKIPTLINRCGVLTGPWQMGKVDQGFVALWVARHYFKDKLNYIGFNGSGKQLRDILHVDDLFALLNTQLTHLEKHQGHVYNVGGGHDLSVSLLELTNFCQAITGNTIAITPLSETREADIPYYVTDNTLITQKTDWKPSYTLEKVLQDIFNWINENPTMLKRIFL